MNEELSNFETIDLQIAKRYNIISKLGKGAYGIVWKAIDKLNNSTIALKKVFGAFQNVNSSKRIYRELSYLKYLNNAPNIIKLINVHRSDNDSDLYIVMECMETDLFAVIRANILLDIHKKFIFWQIMVSLKYIHSTGLIHRDLKPSNILINSDAKIKICDFGLSRTIEEFDIEEENMTEYIATRWYRAPELLFGSSNYSFPIDIWASGCILVELLTGRVLFPGNSSIDQIEKILLFTGIPNEELIYSINSNFDINLLSCLNLNKNLIKLEEKFPELDKDSIDLIKNLLILDPKKRFTAEQALEHPFLKQFHKIDKEPISKEKILLNFNENKRFTIREYKNKVYYDFVTSPDIGIYNKNKFKKKKY